MEEETFVTREGGEYDVRRYRTVRGRIRPVDTMEIEEEYLLVGEAFKDREKNM